jgi:hypothetical protein
MSKWSHDLRGSDSWVSLIFGELGKKPEEDEQGRTVRATSRRPKA